MTFTFSPTQRALRDMFEQNRAWLESTGAAGRRPADRRAPPTAEAPAAAAPPDAAASEARPDKKAALREQALAEPACRRCSKSFPRKSATSRKCEVMNIQQMMKQAQQMQERLQQQMAELRVEGNAGGGMVTVVVNGAKQVQSLKIDPEVVSKEDVEMLQDLIVAADQRRPAQGGRGDVAEDGRHAAGPRHRQLDPGSHS